MAARPDKPEGFIALSESAQIRTNIGFLLTTLGMVGVGVLGFATLRSDVTSLRTHQIEHKARMETIDATHTARMAIIEADWRSVREVLIRIDERTEQIKRDQSDIKAQIKASAR